MPKTGKVTQSAIDEFPEGALWNAFVDLLAMSRENELTSYQKPAFFAFWYELEVSNGGHRAYFENRGVEEAEAAISGLEELGATSYAETLTRALDAWRSEVDDDQLLSIDVEFKRLQPRICEMLEDHLRDHRGLFVEIEEAVV